MKQLFCLLLAAIALDLSQLPLAAQNPPRLRPPIPSPEPIPEIEPLPPLEQLLPQPDPPPATPQPFLEVIPSTIVVQQFKVVGSTVFSPEQLATVLEPYRGRPITFAELLQTQEAVTRLYFDNGYITSGAFIPPQELKDGTILIEVVEGAVEEIEVTGLDHLRTSYILSRLRAATKAPLNQKRLLNALQLLQLDPLIAELSAELSAGTYPGSSRLNVTVKEASAFSLVVRLDNQHVSSVGTNRRLIEIGYGNVLGFGDRLNLRYYNTDGSNAIDDASYTIPINADNGTIGFNFRVTDSEVIEEPFNRLDINSKYYQYELAYRQPILRAPNEEFALGMTIDHQNSDFSLAETLDGETEITALRLFQEYTKRSDRQVFAARSQFTIGINAFERDLNNTESNRSFFAWRGQVQYLNLLTPDVILLLSSDVQLSSDTLLPLEQFGVGGALTVRGYAQDLLLADNGLFASVELRTTILRIPNWSLTLQLTPFFDVGTVWNNDSFFSLSTRSLYSVGLGLRLQVSDKFNAQLDWGIPLANLDVEKNNLQENGIYFVVEYKPF